MLESEITLSLVVAMAQNRVIGRDNALPWRLPKDLAYFKKVTMGYPIIMGRKTFDSIGRPLPGRENIVVTHQLGWAHEGVQVASSLESAIAKAKIYAQGQSLNEIMLIGGASLYAQVIDRAATLYITEVKADVEGDALFPEYDVTSWHEVSRESHGRDQSNPYDYAFTVYRRNGSS